jgi:hypothetical protein
MSPGRNRKARSCIVTTISDGTALTRVAGGSRGWQEVEWLVGGIEPCLCFQWRDL